MSNHWHTSFAFTLIPLSCIYGGCSLEKYFSVKKSEGCLLDK